MVPRVLIVGAGIAGDTLAVLLDRKGWDLTVVEIAPALREGGQTVDLRGASRDVLERLGVLDQCLNALIPQRGAAWVTANGRRLAEMPVEALGGNGLVSSEELLRTDLARIIHAAGSSRIKYLWGETIEALEDTAGGIRVSFRNGSQQTYDLVVGSDGAHSRVRALRFGPEADYRTPLGVAHAWFTIDEKPETPALEGWFEMHNAPGCRMVSARPGHSGQQEVGMSFKTNDLPLRNDRNARLALLSDVFADVGWRAAEFLQAAPLAHDFALDTYDQIAVPIWHKGRVVLLGDSAWCASPLSGAGTALALLGAEALATQLNGAGNLATDQLEVALASYQQKMTPATTAARKLPPGRVPLYVPRTRVGIHISAWVMRAIQSRLVGRIVERSEHNPDNYDVA